jgi:HSP20 family protein
MLGYWTDFDRTLAWMDALRRRMEQGYDQSYEQAESTGQLTLKDDGKALQLTALVPGIPQDQLKVSLHDNVLTISGERKNDVPEGYKVHRRERGMIQFSRSFTLPSKVDADKTTAELKDGVLTLTLEKAAEAQPRQISVRAA